MVEIAPETVVKSAEKESTINIPPELVKQLLLQKLQELPQNTIIQRKKLYRSFEIEYRDKCGSISQIILDVDRQFKILKSKQIVTALCTATAFILIFDFLTKPFEGLFHNGLMYILVGSIFVAFRIIATRYKMSDENILQTKWIFLVGVTGIIFGVTSFFASKYHLIPKYTTLNPFSIVSSLASDQMSGTADKRNQELKAITGQIERDPSAGQDTSLSQTLSPRKPKLEDDYCTVVATSLLEVSLGKISLSSNIFQNEIFHLSGMLVVSVSNKELLQANVGIEGAELEGDFGVLRLQRNGDFRYVLKNYTGIGKFEKFQINVKNEISSEIKQALYISLVGPDYVGTASRDTIFGGVGKNRILGMGGGDWLYGNNNDDIIDGGEGDDLIAGHSGNDILIGGPGNDVIYGGEGDDKIYGDDGDDHLIGNEGKNTLVGGSGADIFWFIVSGKSPDTIVDFNSQEGDKLEFSHLLPHSLQKGDLTSFIRGDVKDDGLLLLVRRSTSKEFEPIVLLLGFGRSLVDLISSDSIIFSKSSNQ